MEINEILCFISTARNSLAADYIIATVHAFYDFCNVKIAKDLLSKLCGKQSVRRRNEEKFKAEIKDILELFEVAENENLTLPKFVADNFNSLPPTAGFECVAKRLATLTEELESLQAEIKNFREAKETYSKGMEECLNIKLDVADIKIMLQKSQKKSEAGTFDAKSFDYKTLNVLPPDFLNLLAPPMIP